MKKLLIFIIFLCLSGFGSTKTENNFPKKNIFLFGEVHFVQEKYKEIIESIVSIIDSSEASDTVNLFLELPTSFEFVVYRLKEYGDTTFFNNYYNNMYYKKTPPSKFWLDFKQLLLDFMSYCDAKKIEWNIRCIDIERNFRNSAYVLNYFDSDLDSLLSQKYIMDDSLNRNYLIKKTHDIKQMTLFKDKELTYLDRIEQSLRIECHLCQKRDSFMYSNFTDFVDSSNNLNFGIFGIKHLLLKKSHKVEENSFTQSQFNIEEGDMVPFFGLFSESLKSKTYRIGIIAFQHKIFNSNFKISKDYEYLMSNSERKYLEQQLGSSKVLRINTKPHNDRLTGLSKKIDYLILYNESQYAK
ncbi:MAG: hypothetical protein COA32_05425 [Fluviicola sp.]|nr:MAG: hypothetical protein COA32_05425 [Fluviicola sp.]